MQCALSICEEKYFVAMNYVTMFVNIRNCSFLTVPSNRTEILVTAVRSLQNPRVTSEFVVSNVPVLEKHCQKWVTFAKCINVAGSLTLTTNMSQKGRQKLDILQRGL